jgi:hypothetical protein
MKRIDSASLGQSRFRFSWLHRHRREPQPGRLVDRLQSHHAPQRITRLDFASGFG